MITYEEIQSSKIARPVNLTYFVESAFASIVDFLVVHYLSFIRENSRNP
jgi:hypothetical protein